MSSTRVSPADIGTTDIFASPFSAGRPGSGLGLDVECTKAAVDLQNMAAPTSEGVIRTSLDTLRRATAADGAFLALLDSNADRFEKVTTTVETSHAGPAALDGEELANFPFLASRFDHLRLTEYRDTARPGREDPAEAARWAGMGFSSVLLVALHMQKRPAGVLVIVRTSERGAWDVNYQLLLKLIGTSLSTGMERLATATRLAEIDERNALVDAASNDGLWDFNFDTNELYLSPRWKAMMGYEDIGPDEIVDWRGMVHPDDLSRVQDAMFKHVSGAVPLFESVHRMRHRNGDYRWVISRAKGRIDKQGRLQRLLGVELDITERKLYEEALFREKEAAQITLQAIGDGVITTDADSIIDYINPVAETLTGWRLEDAMRKPANRSRTR
jgi:PAS domain S-box-containing protein